MTGWDFQARGPQSLGCDDRPHRGDDRGQEGGNDEGRIHKIRSRKAPCFAQCHTSGDGREKEPGLDLKVSFHWAP